MTRITSTALVVQNGYLAVQPGAVITVQDDDENTLQIYSDEALTQSLGNSFTADESGAYDFHVAASPRHVVTTTFGGQSVEQAIYASQEEFAERAEQAAEDAELATATVQQIAETISASKYYDSKADADEDVINLDEETVVAIFEDETRGNVGTRYRVEGGVLVFKSYSNMYFTTLAELAASGLAAGRTVDVEGIPYVMVPTATDAVTGLGVDGIERFNFETVAELQASLQSARGEGEKWSAGLYTYTEAATSATDNDIVNAAGVKLYVDWNVGGILPDQFGADSTGNVDSTAELQKWLNHAAKTGGYYRGKYGGDYLFSFDRFTTSDRMQQAALVCEVTDNSIPPLDIDFGGAEWFCTGTGSGRVANGSYPYGGVGEYGAAIRFSKPIQANRSMRASVRNIELDMSGFTNPIAALIFDDWEKAQNDRFTIKDFNPDDDWCFAVTVRNVYFYSERTDWSNINHVASDGGLIAWFGADRGVFPITFTDHNGTVRNAGDAFTGTQSFARTTVSKLSGAASKTGNGYAVAILGGVYDSLIDGVTFNGGNIAIVYVDGAAGGTRIEGVNSEQPRLELSLTGSMDVGVSDTTLTVTTAEFADYLAYGNGAHITVAGAGAGGADLVTRIDSFTSSTVVELTDAASTTVSSASVTVHRYCGVEISGSSNSAALSNISAGDAYKQVDTSLYTGGTYDVGAGASGERGPFGAWSFTVLESDRDEPVAWIVNEDEDAFVYPLKRLDNVSADTGVTTVVVPASILQSQPNAIWEVRVQESGNAFQGVAQIQANGQSTPGLDLLAIAEKNLTFSVSGGALSINHTTGNTETARISYQRKQ